MSGPPPRELPLLLGRNVARDAEASLNQAQSAHLDQENERALSLRLPHRPARRSRDSTDLVLAPDGRADHPDNRDLEMTARARKHHRQPRHGAAGCLNRRRIEALLSAKAPQTAPSGPSQAPTPTEHIHKSADVLGF